MVAAFHHVSAVLLLDPKVERIELDVLVLGDDRAATDTVQALAARIPGAELIVVPGVGHMVNMEAPGRLTAELRRFVAAN